ncbi:molybdopterin molybdotransferase MoeA [Nigerium massiliense]|uniref:molybdopterin molybdotransferase MoeA n=1 Tax=Nigerium massiliense TaxID=1522317 RepID=UPI00058B5F9C|nr:gephyrin-like molybdotransferase Glp [Nigerium massiliense]
MALFGRRKKQTPEAVAPAEPEPIDPGPVHRTLEEQRDVLLAAVEPLRPFGLSILDAAGLTICEDIVSDLNLPLVTTARVEGYGVRSANLVGASPRHAIDLKLLATASPGDPVPDPLPAGGTIFLEEGAPVPAGVDAIVPDEAVELKGRTAYFTAEAPQGEHLHERGSELREGETLLKSGDVLNPRTIALLAEAGLDKVLVRPRPRLVVLGVDGTLVQPGLPLTSAGQRYDSATALLATAGRADGATVFPVGVVQPDAAAVRQAIVDQGIRADLILVVGGSAEETQIVADVLGELGTLDKADVAMNGGTPYFFGRAGADGVPVLVLPGGVVSAFIGYHAFVRPLIAKLTDISYGDVPRRWATLSGDVHSVGEGTRYVPAVLEGRRVTPVASAGHELAFDLARANVLLTLPHGRARDGWDVECLVLNDTDSAGPDAGPRW